MQTRSGVVPQRVLAFQAVNSLLCGPFRLAAIAVCLGGFAPWPDLGPFAAHS
jgi:hypothetical protein